MSGRRSYLVVLLRWPTGDAWIRQFRRLSNTCWLGDVAGLSTVVCWRVGEPSEGLYSGVIGRLWSIVVEPFGVEASGQL